MTDVVSHKPRGILASLALEGWKRATTVEGYDMQYYKDENVTSLQRHRHPESPSTCQSNSVARCIIDGDKEQTTE